MRDSKETLVRNLRLACIRILDGNDGLAPTMDAIMDSQIVLCIGAIMARSNVDYLDPSEGL